LLSLVVAVAAMPIRVPPPVLAVVAVGLKTRQEQSHQAPTPSSLVLALLGTTVVAIHPFTSQGNQRVAATAAPVASATIISASRVVLVVVVRAGKPVVAALPGKDSPVVPLWDQRLVPVAVVVPLT